MPGHQAVQVMGTLGRGGQKAEWQVNSNLVSRDGIAHTSVKPCRHNNQLRIKLEGDRKNNVEEGHEVLWVPVALPIPRDIDVITRPLAPPNLVKVSISAAGVEFPVIISDRSS